jgi:predicted membrane-bound mannosyltransferase
MPLLLTWWALATFALYSWAGEKMPWLTVHVALPIVLLGAWALARVLGWWTAGMSAPAHSAAAVDTESILVDTSNGNGHARTTLLMPRPRIWESGLLIYLSIYGTVAAQLLVLIRIVAKTST